MFCNRDDAKARRFIWLRQMSNEKRRKGVRSTRTVAPSRRRGYKKTSSEAARMNLNQGYLTTWDSAQFVSNRLQALDHHSDQTPQVFRFVGCKFFPFSNRKLPNDHPCHQLPQLLVFLQTIGDPILAPLFGEGLVHAMPLADVRPKTCHEQIVLELEDLTQGLILKKLGWSRCRGIEL